MNPISNARLKLMYNNLKEMNIKRNKLYHEGNLDESTKMDIRIKMKQEQINRYKKEIGL